MGSWYGDFGYAEAMGPDPDEDVDFDNDRDVGAEEDDS